VRYTGGKVDWAANGLPMHSAARVNRRAGDVARRDVPTCRPGQRRGDVSARLASSGWNACVVIDDDRVVLGLLDDATLQGDADALVEQAMREAPSTIRPHMPIEDAADKLRHQDREQIIVTSPDGKLIGVLGRADTERPQPLDARAGARRDAASRAPER
jgi:CBS domain-containing protein